MKTLLYSLMTLLLATTALQASEMTELQTVEEIGKIIQMSKEEIWPGVDYNTPTVIAFKDGHVFAFNLKTDNPAWKPVKAGPIPVLYAEKDLWNVHSTALHTAFPVDGQKVFLYNIDNRDELSVKTFAHERFHVYQTAKFRDAPEDKFGKGYQDQQNTDNLALMQVEEEILHNFLGSKQNRKEILKDYIVIHEARAALLQKPSDVWENFQQKMEGLADYISTKMLRGEEMIRENMEANTKNQDISDRAVKWRHYAVGAALAYALDECQVQGWKEQVETKGAHMNTLLAQALPMSSEEKAQRLEKVKSKYNFIAFRDKVDHTLKTHHQELDNLNHDYQSMSGVVIQLAKPQRVSISGGGSTAHLYYLADGSTLSLEDDSMAESSDNNWKLQTRVPYLFQYHGGLREFKVDESTVIYIDNKPITCKELVKSNKPVTFTKLAWKNESTTLKSEKHAGTILISEGKIKVDYL